MKWELRHVEDTEAILDDSGVYIVIHRIEIPGFHKEYSGIRVLVRADLMTDDGNLIMSWQGSANAVRKAIARFFDEECYFPSLEHAAYIGYELHRAESTPNFVQD